LALEDALLYVHIELVITFHFCQPERSEGSSIIESLD